MSTETPGTRIVWPGRSDAPALPLASELRQVAPARTATRSRLVLGDHGPALAALAPELEGRVDLVYVDPPFDTGRTRRDPAGAPVYQDRWRPGQWLDALERLLLQVRELLGPTGSLVLHCDHRRSHHAAVLCDELFGRGARGSDPGAAGFRNEIVWCYALGGSSPRYYPRKHDSLLWYSRGRTWTFDPPRMPARSRRMAGRDKKVPDWWDLPSLNNMASERTGYPTQKPLALLERLVLAHSRPGELVLDPCCGSGTTVVAAARTGRAFVGIDRLPRAVETTRRRLQEEGAGFVELAADLR